MGRRLAVGMGIKVVEVGLALVLALVLAVGGPAFKLAVWEAGLDWLAVLVFSLLGAGLVGGGVAILFRDWRLEVGDG